VTGVRNLASSATQRDCNSMVVRECSVLAKVTGPPATGYHRDALSGLTRSLSLSVLTVFKQRPGGNDQGKDVATS
jgi:hypothetical protein